MVIKNHLPGLAVNPDHRRIAPEPALTDQPPNEPIFRAPAVSVILAVSLPVLFWFQTGLADGVGFERRVFHSLFATEDQKEGMDAFVNKRKPVFRHR